MLGRIKKLKKKKKISKTIVFITRTLVTVTRLIQFTVDFQCHYFVLILVNVDTFHHASIMASIPSEGFFSNNLLKIQHCFKLNMKTVSS